MLSIIQVQCPHCGVQGQIAIPPLGSLIIGPCPSCNGLVAIFCGKALPLHKETMMEGGREERREHLMTALNQFLEDRIEQLIDRLDPELIADALNNETQLGFEPQPDEDLEKPELPSRAVTEQITEDEVNRFLVQELPKLDDPSYFNAIFEPRK
ncbi:MAG: hypothetical protein AMXMBFR84_25420 [Candidatus Hydrogenedentota bacterium]